MPGEPQEVPAGPGPTEPPPEIPPSTPAQPTEPPQEDPPGSPMPDIPPPVREPGDSPTPDELPGHTPDEFPVRGPAGPDAPNPAINGPTL